MALLSVVNKQQSVAVMICGAYCPNETITGLTYVTMCSAVTNSAVRLSHLAVFNSLHQIYGKCNLYISEHPKTYLENNNNLFNKSLLANVGHIKLHL